MIRQTRLVLLNSSCHSLRANLTLACGWSSVTSHHPHSTRASPVAQMVKNLPAMQETRVWSLGQEASLENGMATHSSILVWRIPWTEEPGRLQFVGSQRVGHNWAITLSPSSSLEPLHIATPRWQVPIWQPALEENKQLSRPQDEQVAELDPVSWH